MHKTLNFEFAIWNICCELFFNINQSWLSNKSCKVQISTFWWMCWITHYFIVEQFGSFLWILFTADPTSPWKKKWVKKDDVVFQMCKKGYIWPCAWILTKFDITNNIPRLIRPVKIHIKIITSFYALFLVKS